MRWQNTDIGLNGLMLWCYRLIPTLAWTGHYMLILWCYRLMIRCYRLMLCCYTYDLPIHLCSRRSYITVLCYISVPTFTFYIAATQLILIYLWAPSNQKASSQLFFILRKNNFFILIPQLSGCPCDILLSPQANALIGYTSQAWNGSYSKCTYRGSIIYSFIGICNKSIIYNCIIICSSIIVRSNTEDCES